MDSPEPALNGAVAWALSRVGGALRVESVATATGFGPDELHDLLDDAKRWYRVRDGRLLDPTDLLSRVVGGLFGARVDGAGLRLQIRPLLPEGWRRVTARRVRAHRTLFDLEVRPRAEWTTVRLAITFGPSVATEISLPASSQRVVRVTVDEIPLGAPRAVFTAVAEHEVVLFTA